jgi:hypothetical protein
LEFGDSREFLESLQAKGQTVAALDREPLLDADEQVLLGNFYMLSRLRPVAFDGIANLQLADIIALHKAERWEECGYTLIEYVELMLELDKSLKQFHKERRPRS